MVETERFEQVEVDSSEALWAWLDAHHAQTESIWLVTFKKVVPERYLSRDAVLDALVAYGWTDGVRRKLDDERTMQLVGPRKEQVWAATYKARAARLEAEGRMQGPGRASIERAKAEGLWDVSDPVDALVVPEDLAAALASEPLAEAFFHDAAPSYRRNVLRWIAKAKRAPTREKRIATTVAASGRREKVPQL